MSLPFFLVSPARAPQDPLWNLRWPTTPPPRRSGFKDRRDNHQLLLNVLVPLFQELFRPLQDAVLGRDLRYFQAFLLVKGVLASELVNVPLKLK